MHAECPASEKRLFFFLSHVAHLDSRRFQCRRQGFSSSFLPPGSTLDYTHTQIHSPTHTLALSSAAYRTWQGSTTAPTPQTAPVSFSKRWPSHRFGSGGHKLLLLLVTAISPATGAPPPNHPPPPRPPSAPPVTSARLFPGMPRRDRREYSHRWCLLPRGSLSLNLLVLNKVFSSFF